jgi:hypothetical protein
MRHITVICSAALIVAAGGAPSPEPLVVHEWGTITTHEDVRGVQRGGLNRIAASEVLPAFVHRYDPATDPRNSLLKTALGAGHPDVTMRLETPVIYFYPPRGAVIRPFDVSVKFRGGVLNEFYPAAAPSCDGVPLKEDAAGSLRWAGVSLQDEVPIPRTTSHVWLAPRAPHSSGVAVGTEGERYLFYRGVAQLSAPLRTERSGQELVLRAPPKMPWLTAPKTAFRGVWVVSVRPDGRTAFRALPTLLLEQGKTNDTLEHVRLFTEADHSAAHRGELRLSMRDALVAAGLFGDEADAMLETWKDSYFTTPGLRVFYIAPPEWIAYHLPMQISTPHVLTRVLVGRIDLVE